MALIMDSKRNRTMVWRIQNAKFPNYASYFKSNAYTFDGLTVKPIYKDTKQRHANPIRLNFDNK